MGESRARKPVGIGQAEGQSQEHRRALQSSTAARTSSCRVAWRALCGAARGARALRVPSIGRSTVVKHSTPWTGTSAWAVARKRVAHGRRLAVEAVDHHRPRRARQALPRRRSRDHPAHHHPRIRGGPRRSPPSENHTRSTTRSSTPVGTSSTIPAMAAWLSFWNAATWFSGVAFAAAVLVGCGAAKPPQAHRRKRQAAPRRLRRWPA